MFSIVFADHFSVQAKTDWLDDKYPKISFKINTIKIKVLNIIASLI